MSASEGSSGYLGGIEALRAASPMDEEKARVTGASQVLEYQGDVKALCFGENAVSKNIQWWEGARETRVLIAPDPCTVRKPSVGKFLSLRHPKTGNAVRYLYNDGVLQELHVFKQCYGSWFLGDYTCEDGSMYMATPVDPVFILLPIFEEARMKKGDNPGIFRTLDDIIFVSGYPAYESLLSIAETAMQVVSDIKDIGSAKFFRLNDLKVLKWLCYKVNQLKLTLKTLDSNYAVQDEKQTLRDAVSILGDYLKEEPWINMLCDKLKVNLSEIKVGKNMELPSDSTGNSVLSHQEKTGGDKKAAKSSTRQVKKPKVEKDSHNIKDMFFRAARKRS